MVDNVADLPAAAGQLLHLADGRKKMAFYGDIGAGKTTLIQAICKQLSVQEAVVSPTFALVHEYSFTNALNVTELIYHLDLYRLKNIQEALDIGVEDLLYNEHYTFIEWPELVEDLLPEETIRIKIEALPDSSRKIVFLD
jgi:tRNA threonylcarbamoyladenosine biosynthesis protein TsaE